MSLSRASGKAALTLLALMLLPSLGQASPWDEGASAPEVSVSATVPVGLPSPEALPGVNASDQSQPDIAIDGSRVQLVWVSVDGGRSRVFHSSSTDLANWSLPRALGPASADANATGPRVATGAGKVYVVWRESNASATVVRFATSLDSGGNFTRSGAVSPSPLPAATPVSISIASVGDDLHVAWAYPSADGGDLSVRSSTNATAGFQPALTVPGAGPQSSPAAAAYGAAVLIAWEDGRNGEPDVFSWISKDRGATYSVPTPAFVGQSGVAQRRPATTVDPTGRWWLGWEDETGGQSLVNVSWTLDAPFPRGVRPALSNITPGTLGFASGSGHLGVVDGLSSRAMAARRIEDSYSAPARIGNASVLERGLRGASYHGSSTLFAWSNEGGGNDDLRVALLPWRGPSVTFNSPSSGTLIGAAGAMVAWNSTDSDGTAAAASNLSWSQDLVTWTVSASGLQPDDSYLWKPPASVKGPTFIRVSSADTLSNRDDAVVEVRSDPVAPSAIAFDPAPGASGVRVGSSVTITFSELMHVGSVAQNFSIVERGTTITGSIEWTGGQMMFNATAPGLLEGRRYEVRLLGGKDSAGNDLPMPVIYEFTTNDTTAPTIDLISPIAGDRWNLSTRTVRWKTQDAGVIPSGGVDIRYSVDNGSKWSDLALDLDDTGSYNWSIPPVIDTDRARLNVTVRDLVGNVGNRTSQMFEIDSIVPTIANSTPPNTATKVPSSVIVRVNLSEAVNKSLTEASALLRSTKGDVTGDVKWFSNLTFTFTPRQNLSLATRYYMNFTTVDKAGNRLEGSFWFRTADNRPPEITIFSPKSDSVVNGIDRFDIQYAIKEDTNLKANGITISLALDTPTKWQTIISGWSDDQVYTWLPNLKNESKAAFIKVEALDEDDNRGEKISVAFTLDSRPPLVESSTPANGSTEIPLDGTFIFEFNEQMAGNAPNVTFDVPAGQISTNWTSKRILQVRHSLRFSEGLPLTLIVSDARDEAGNPMASSYRLVGTTTVFPSKAHVKGIVVSAEGALLENVDVIGRNLTGGTWAAKTERNGSFAKGYFTPGQYVITFNHPGYRETKIQRNFLPGNITDLQDIVLFPADSTLPSYLPLFVLLLAVVGLIVLFILISRRMSVASEGEELKAYLRTDADAEMEKPPEDGERDDEPAGAEPPSEDPAPGKKKEEAAASEE